MIALELLDVKESMGKLLLSETFDPFLFVEGTITTFNTFTIDGYLKKEFLDSEESAKLLEIRDFSLWKDMKGFCFSIIKGKKTPLNFKFIFRLSKENTSKLLQQEGLSYSISDIQGLYLNLKFDGQRLECITGTSMSLFTMDKSLEHAWDKMVQKFFQHHKIAFEIQ